MPKKTTSSKTEKLPNFEKSLEELEDLVDRIESEQIDLESLVSRFERGACLLKHCRALLSDANKRIEMIELNDPESTKIKNSLEDKAALGNDSSDFDDTQDDEIELF